VLIGANRVVFSHTVMKSN